MISEMARIAMVGLCALALSGCGEQPPAERPPEARATPRVVDETAGAAPAAAGEHSAVRHGYSADGKPVPHDRQGGDKGAHDHAGHDHTGHDHAGHDHSAHDHPTQASPAPSPSPAKRAGP